MVINLLGPIHSSTSVLLLAREIFLLRSQRTRMQILPSIQQNQGHSCSNSSPTSDRKHYSQCYRNVGIKPLSNLEILWLLEQPPAWLRSQRSWKAFHFYTLFALASHLITSSLIEPRPVELCNTLADEFNNYNICLLIQEHILSCTPFCHFVLTDPFFINMLNFCIFDENGLRKAIFLSLLLLLHSSL